MHTRFRRKLVVVGDGACGKTSLLLAFSKGTFSEQYVPTVFDNSVVDVKVDGQQYELSLWDTAGQEDYDRLRPLSYSDTHVVLICFSIINPDSLENITEKVWHSEVLQFCGSVPIVLVGLKADLREDQRAVTQLNQRPLAYEQGYFDERYVPTIFDNTVHDTVIDGQLCELSLWDTAGQEDYDNLRPLSYSDTDVVLICFAIDSPDSLDNVATKWHQEVLRLCRTVPIFLVGLKADLRSDPETILKLKKQDEAPVKYEDGIRVAASIGAQYIECSAKTRQGVPNVFEVAGRAAIAFHGKQKKQNRKFTIVGDRRIGKSTLIYSKLKNRFVRQLPASLNTIHTEINDQIKIQADGKSAKVFNWEYPFWLIDTDIVYEKLKGLVYAGGDAILLCFDIGNRDTLSSLSEKWIQEIMNFGPCVPRVVVGMKSDTRVNNMEKPVSFGEGKEMARLVGAFGYVECSSKTRGVDQVFLLAAQAIQGSLKWPKKKKIRHRRPSLPVYAQLDTHQPVDLELEGEKLELINWELVFWDSEDDYLYERLRPLIYCDGDAILMCFDISDKDTLMSLSEKWVQEILKFAPGMPVVVVGLKADTRDSSSVTYEQGNKMALVVGACAYVECSAKTKEGVDEVFVQVAKAICSRPLIAKRNKCVII
ncbi:hypothetical protein HDV01_000148 [Terramyces sp. JEL0728]|nr:hypothetical protein HDV01_000148 [Terramyces sp. JEL0728]